MKAWLIDSWNTGNKVCLWVKDETGKDLFLEDFYYPIVYMKIRTPRGRELFDSLCQNSLVIPVRELDKQGLWTGKFHSVVECRVVDQVEFQRFMKNAYRFESQLYIYNTEIEYMLKYMIDRDLYPMCEVELDSKTQKIRRVPHHSLFPEYPSFKKIYLRAKWGKVKMIGKDNPIVVKFSESEDRELSPEPVSLLRELNEILIEHDPDIIFSSQGDEFLLPYLFEMSYKHRIKLLLDRDSVISTRKSKPVGRSLFSYGRVVFKTTPFPLFGRLHIDRGLSFFYHESELEGILEVCRYSRLGIQRLARSSPGSAMSAMEDEVAMQLGVLIPRSKGQASQLKPISLVLKADQGGLSFRPPVGLYENVLEYDYRSLYPSCMRKYNISGETINCQCCASDGTGIPVPFLPYHICSKRKGIVANTIDQLLKRRDELKYIISHNSLSDMQKRILELRSTAIKWCLVTSFGYTGFKNAKYGQREAHESITAWGREALLVAKEVAEDFGYSLLHALTDSIWIRKDSTNPQDISQIADEINTRTGLKIIFEASYSWICFPSSKVIDYFSVPTRYYARETSGKMKVRGLLIRKKDTPPIVCQFQEEALGILSQCSTISEIEEKDPAIRQLYNRYKDQIYSGKLDSQSLSIRKTVSREADDYIQNNSSKIILDIFKEQGISIMGGQNIHYIVVDTTARDFRKRYTPSHLFQGKYDAGFYAKILKSALGEVLPHCQFTKKEHWKVDQGALFGD
jgi:DNA polymerase-2